MGLSNSQTYGKQQENLYALTRVASYMDQSEPEVNLNLHLLSWLSYCTLLWMYDYKQNNKNNENV